MGASELIQKGKYKVARYKGRAKEDVTEKKFYFLRMNRMKISKVICSHCLVAKSCLTL